MATHNPAIRRQAPKKTKKREVTLFGTALSFAEAMTELSDGSIRKSRAGKSQKGAAPEIKINDRGIESLVAAAKPRLKPNDARDLILFLPKTRSDSPMSVIHLEAAGIGGSVVKALANLIDVPANRFYSMIGMPKATVERRARSEKTIAGASGQAAIGVAQLLSLANQIVANSTAAEAASFDTGKWLGEWLETPQQALGMNKPGDLLATRTGLEVVSRLLGSMESGAYQ